MRNQTEIEYQQRKTRRKWIAAFFSLLITAGLCALVLVFAWYIVVPAALLFGLIFYAISSRSPSLPDTISASDDSSEIKREVEDVPLLEGTGNERSVAPVQGQSPTQSATHDEEESVGTSSDSEDEEKALTPSYSTPSSSTKIFKGSHASIPIPPMSEIPPEVKKEISLQEKKEEREIYGAKGMIQHYMLQIFSPHYKLQKNQWKILDGLIDQTMQVEEMSHQEKLKFIKKVETKCSEIASQIKDGKESISGYGFSLGADYKQQAFQSYLETMQKDLADTVKAHTFEYSPSQPDDSELKKVEQKIWDIFKWIAKGLDKAKLKEWEKNYVEGGLSDLLHAGLRGKDARKTDKEKLVFAESIHHELDGIRKITSPQEKCKELTEMVGARLIAENFNSPGFGFLPKTEEMKERMKERSKGYKKPVPSSPGNPPGFTARRGSNGSASVSSEESDTPQAHIDGPEPTSDLTSPPSQKQKK